MKRTLAAFALAFCAVPVMAQTISTAAGNGVPNNYGDGGPATSAAMYVPASIAINPAGGYYIGTYGAIRKVDANGTITTVAGSGIAGFAGDGGPASEAKFGYRLGGLELSPSGELYIADSSNSRIRKIDRTGTISTVVGNGEDFSDGIPAASARIGYPTAVQLDAVGNLYFTDLDACNIRKVDLSGLISTIAGTGVCTSSGDGGPATSATLNHPWGLRFDAQGNLFVAEHSGNRIRKIAPGGTITSVAGTGSNTDSGDGGSAIAAGISGPTHLDFDAAGNLYVAEYYGNRVRRISPSGTISTVAGSGASGASGDGGAAVNAAVGAASAVKVANGRFYIAQPDAYRVRQVIAPITPQGNQSTTTCASEGYTGTKLTWCQNICEKGYTGATLSSWIKRWTDKYRDLPYCAAK